MRFVAVLVIALLVLFADRCTKFWIQFSMEPGESIPLVNGIFHLSYVQNPGAAFGIMQDRIPFFVLVTLVVVGLILFLVPRLPPGYPGLRLATGLLLGGALGNLIDRVRFGYVVDFLDFRVWPVFNVADIAIVVGVGLFLWVLLTKSPEGLL